MTGYYEGYFVIGLKNIFIIGARLVEYWQHCVMLILYIVDVVFLYFLFCNKIVYNI